MKRRRRKRIQVKHTVGRGGWGGRGGGYEAEKIETVCGESGQKKIPRVHGTMDKERGANS